MSLSFSSVIRGHHIYKTIWTTYLGKELVLAAEEDIVNLLKALGFIETQLVWKIVCRQLEYVSYG